MEYIEREAVNALIEAECSPKVAAYLIDAVATIPAADVRPVKWIPVTERLPEMNQIVVVVQRGKTWDYGQFRGLDYLGGNIHKWIWKNNTTKTVDYWMPKKSALPEPPKEE